MSDLIYRQAAIERLTAEANAEGAYGYVDTKTIVDCLNSMPSAQPERKTGKWMKEDRGGVEYTAVCSECEYAAFWSDAKEYKYCPNCGKKMEEWDE